MKKILALILCFFTIFSIAAFREDVHALTEPSASEEPSASGETAAGGETEISYTYAEFPLERNGIALHLDCISVEGTSPEKSILLVHGLTYSSHEFDIDYKDYSLVRFLAREGYAVWRLDIAGYGQSGAVEDGFLPDSDYAAEDIYAAVRTIVAETGLEKIDILGWSWGTVTSSRFVAKHPEYVDRLVLYAPILCGLGAANIEEPFHQNTWEHAVDDFQRDENGDYDLTIVESVVLEMYASSCWHYDDDSSPNGGRRDLCVDASELLIDLEAISVPTLIICGDADPYLDMELVRAAPEKLTEGSALEIIPGASHCAMLELPYYHDFQQRLSAYLSR